MKILAFDLELNQATSGAKIIEIGACVGDTQTKQIIAEYTALVNPHEIMEPKITVLTGITQAMVDAGTSVVNAYEGMIQMAMQHQCLKMPLTWGCGDLPALQAELPLTATKYFGRREVDAKTLYQCLQIYREGEYQAGLAAAMSNLGLQFLGRQHRATDDAKNTFVIFCHLLEQFK